MNGIVHATVGWLTEGSPRQRRALLAAGLGWMLDSMDMMLYALVLGHVQRDLHLSAGMSGAMISVTLLAAALGGSVFGWWADRAGRVRALTWSMLVYSIATALCGFAQTAAVLMLCRILVGLGMGGEWGAGAALVAESWPAQHRAKALALVQSCWAIGYALGAVVVAIVLPRFGWRAVFFVGVAPALVTLWLRRSLPEPEEWQLTHTTPSQRIPLRTLIHGEMGRNLLICSAMNAATLFAWWGLFTWVPRFLSMPVSQGGRGLSVLATSTWTVVMQIGNFAGYISFGYIADRISRKSAYIGYLLVAAVLVPIYAFVRDPHVLLWLGPWVGFFGAGYFSGFSVIASELFPAAVRGSALGFSYNIGRVVSAAAPFLIGRLSEGGGLSAALCVTSAAFLAAAVIASALRSPSAAVLREAAELV